MNAPVIIKFAVFGGNQGINEMLGNTVERNIGTALDKKMVKQFAVGTDNTCGKVLFGIF